MRVYLVEREQTVNPHTPVAQKDADEVVFRRFQGEGVEFFLNRTSLARVMSPPQIFDAHLLENTNLSPSSFHFSVVFLSRSYFESDCLIETNEIEEKKRC